MVAAPKLNSPAFPEVAERLLRAMQQGAMLHWSPTTSFVLHMPSGKTCKPPLSAVWPLRRAGLITTKHHDWTKPRLWRVTV
jgi:hypothetical protein